MNLIQKVKSWFGGEEGSWRGPFFGQGEFGNFFELGRWEDGFQRNLTLGSNDKVAIVYACVMLNARAVSQCTATHKRKNSSGSYEAVDTTPAARIFRSPNSYETFPQIITNTVADMLFKGESLWFCVRDDRFAITQVHRVPHGSWSIHVDPETKEIFYSVYTQDVADVTEVAPDYLIPARDCAHFRQYSPRHPMIGESPLAHAALSLGINVSLDKMQMAFFNNMNRSSGILSTDEPLTPEQKDQARQAFKNQAAGWNAGQVPILSHGVKYTPLSITSSDAQLLDAYNATIADICNIYGVPQLMLTNQGGTSAGTEAMVSHWLSVSLGSLLESVERTLDKLFATPNGEKIELDPAPLLRVDYESRIAGLVKSIQGGLLSPEEARAKEGYGTKTGADSLYMQQQMVSLETLELLHAANLADKVSSNEEPAPEPEPEPEPEKKVDPEIAKALVISMFDRKRKSA